jgi:hypothetical protein
VIGTITTDGQAGTLGTSNFLGWNLTLNGNGASFTIASSDANAFIKVQGSDVFATLTEITFNFSAADNGYLLFQDGAFSGMHYWCNAASAGDCFQGMSVIPESFNSSSAINVSASGTQVIASASVPEPSTLGLIGLGLLGLGAMARRRRYS